MTETTWLLVLLVVIYLSECCGWTSKHTVLFRNAWSGFSFFQPKWRWGLPGKWFGNSASGLHFRHPLPPLGSVFHCPVWPASLSPVAALAWVPFSMDRSDRPDQSAALIHWDQARPLVGPHATYAENKVVYLHEQPVVKCATEAHAVRVLDRLHQIQQAPDAASRERAIDAEWDAAFDCGAIRNALERFEAQTKLLRVVANLLFLLVFVVTPITIFFFGLGRVWIALFLPLIGLMFAAAVLFFRAHRQLQPRLDGERWKHTMIVLLSPPGAIRSLDALARDQLIGFHPLAVAHTVLTRARFVEFARQYVLDFRYAMPSQIQAAPQARDTLQWHMRREASHIRAFLEKLNLAVDELTIADPPTDDDCQSYCPRCQCQFVIAAGPDSRCTLCDLPLVSFA